MADYIYECINRQGEIVKGKITADNNSIAVEKLKKMELMIVELKLDLFQNHDCSFLAYPMT